MKKMLVSTALFLLFQCISLSCNFRMVWIGWRF